MGRPVGPDFLCIGMQKAGTDWLFDQLQFHPDFWMPPVKEFHYFDRKITPKIGRATKLLNLSPQRLAQKLSVRRAWDERDSAFLQEASQLQGLDFQRYAALFRYKGSLLSGEITPGYSVLGEAMIGMIDREFPGLKIVLLVRDPVARAWSQISMAYRNDNFDASVLDSRTAFADFLKNSALVGDRSFPTKIAERWKKAGARLEFGYFLFDRLEAEPDRARDDVLRFLGADPGKKSGEIPANQNRKSKLAKLPMTDDILSVLVEHFREELAACAALFGGEACQWPTRYGLSS
jgi:sulfotransferase family protein